MAQRSPSRRELQARLEAAEQEREQLRRELEATRASTSYRLGHVVARAGARLLPRRGSRRAESPGTAASSSGPTREPASEAAAGTTTGADRREGPDGTPETASSTGPTGPQDLLLDATAITAEDAAAVAQRLLDDGGRLTVVHPDQLPLDDLTLVVAPRVPDELAARFGPARTVRALGAAARPPSLLVREAQPLVQPVDEPASTEGLPPGPVFIGGTGRSGTWVLGRMLAQHPRLVCVHTELRFHATPPGFAGVLAGELGPDEYAEIVHRRWFRPKGGAGAAKGLQLLTGNRELRGHLRRFRERAGEDVPGALGQLMLDVVAPYARGRGAVRWAETTPDNARSAAALTTVFPTGQVVHAVRDGRDVAASVVSMPWGPDDHLEALDWWAKRLREADRGMAAADPERVHTVRLEELIHLDREATFERLVAGLGYTDHSAAQHYFEAQMGGAQGHVGRWRRDLDAALRDAFEDRYRTLLDELADEGVTCLPVAPEAADELAGGA